MHEILLSLITGATTIEFKQLVTKERREDINKNLIIRIFCKSCMITCVHELYFNSFCSLLRANDADGKVN